MKNLILVLFTITLGFAQQPETADSIYWSAKYCNSAETIEDCTNSWMWNGNAEDCIQPSEGFCKATFPGVWILDTYECCCQVASLPGQENAWTGFFESPCQAYLDSIGFVYNDPNIINWTSIDEDILKLNGIYIDPFGRQYTIPPKGLSIKNKKKYYRL